MNEIDDVGSVIPCFNADIPVGVKPQVHLNTRHKQTDSSTGSKRDLNVRHKQTDSFTGSKRVLSGIHGREREISQSPRTKENATARAMNKEGGSGKEGLKLSGKTRLRKLPPPKRDRKKEFSFP